MNDKEQVRLATFILRRWQFYELNINKMKNNFHKWQAITFFRALQELEKEEVSLLARMYYKSPTQLYNKWYSAFETCKGASLEEVAEQTGKTVTQVRSELRVIKIKFAKRYNELSNEPKKITLIRDKTNEKGA
ncbi:hypothetical protein [Vagococcus xieshaowenii]|nr:hypothetical protein [Vagococcus xieshaowenii]